MVGCDREGAVCGGEYDRITGALRDDYGLDKDVARHLRYNYGTHALQVVEVARAEPKRFASLDGGFQRLHPQYAPLAAEVAFACRRAAVWRCPSWRRVSSPPRPFANPPPAPGCSVHSGADVVPWSSLSEAAVLP